MTEAPLEPLPRCEAHEGRHPVYLDQCVAVGAEVPRPFAFGRGRCDTCGLALDLRRDRFGRVEHLESGTDRRHHHPPPLAVHLDPDELAVALARASDALRQRRLATSTPDTSDPAAPADGFPSPAPGKGGQAPRGATLGGIPTLTGDG